MDVRPFTFSYAELRTATNDFDSANKLGEGGFGPVYKVHSCINLFRLNKLLFVNVTRIH